MPEVQGLRLCVETKANPEGFLPQRLKGTKKHKVFMIVIFPWFLKFGLARRYMKCKFLSF